jgi:phosphoenolpyruvate synthase/pyruvate phosphate dikinase
LVLNRSLGDKHLRMAYARAGGGTKNVVVPKAQRERFCLTDSEVLKLAGDAIGIESHYSKNADRPMPMDIEWAKDGNDGQIYIIQARPETVISQRAPTSLESYELERTGPVLAVGLARMEFIISEHIKIHPMALVDPKRVSSAVERKKIEQLVRNYENPRDYFIEKLSEGVGTIAAAFYPKPVIVRLSDFKTNEYARLVGGKGFEPKEENPMLGFRGAARYTHPAYEAGFALECAALRRVREDMGLMNVARDGAVLPAR